MLENTLATEFVSGTNVRGDVAGANWVFLLPSLELSQTVCLGNPARAALQTLAAFSDSVAISVDPDQIADLSAANVLANVSYIAPRDDRALPLASGSVDLIYITSGHVFHQYKQVPALAAEITRMLAPQGLIYYECQGYQIRTGASPIDQFSIRRRFWLTPLSGEMHTAVPAVDTSTRRYFLRRRLFSPTITVHTFKRHGKRFSKDAQTDRIEQEGEIISPKPQHSKDRSLRHTVNALARQTASSGIDLITRAERLLYTHVPLASRYGFLSGPQGAVIENGPPAYLREIAQASGVALDHYRWGLWAAGQYSSRKLLFFLFEGSSQSPQILVKMVRAPAFSKRLENERRTLALLAEFELGNKGLTPRVIFHGQHNSLAVVAETAIDGVPFRERTQLTPDCPYTHAVVDWFTELGAISGAAQHVKPEEVARALEILLERFQSVYHIPREQYEFLADHIAGLGQNQDPVPLVFQHGDPGPWNMLVTQDGRVAVLDWEATEPQGMPLWDLLYFLRSYAVSVSRSQGISDRLRGFAEHFFLSSPINAMAVDMVNHYCDRVQLPRHYVEPLFYTCWMHRALKQSTTLPSTEQARGYYVNLLQQSIEQRDSPGLARFFKT